VLSSVALGNNGHETVQSPPDFYLSIDRVTLLVFPVAVGSKAIAMKKKNAAIFPRTLGKSL
jgi:hypothetical protein